MKRYNRFVNTTGYTKGTKTENNPSNIIPSNVITMQNTPYPVLGQPLDQFGNPLGQQTIMEPGQEYYYPEASGVKEVPMFQPGGYFGETNSLSFPGTMGQRLPVQTMPQNNFQNIGQQNMANPWNVNNILTQQDPFGGWRPPQDSSTTVTGTPQYLPEAQGTQQIQTTQQPDTRQPQTSLPSLTPQGITSPNFFDTHLTSLPNSIPQTEDGLQGVVETGTTVTNPDPYQFFNPYVGYDIPSSAYKLGQDIQSGNTFGTVTSGLKLGLGLGRNLLSGMGTANRSEQIGREYQENQRDTITGRNQVRALQEGGEVQEQGQDELVQQVAQALQQGANPEEILASLVEMGIPEDQAGQLIQQIMSEGQQQFRDGGTYLEALKGKTIKNYTLDPNTNEYLVEYE